MSTVHATTKTTMHTGSGPRLPHLGPDRRQKVAQVGDWLAAALDELDYGVLLLTQDAEILYRNHATFAELGDDHPLYCEGRFLRARQAADAVALRDALRSAGQKQLRKLVTLGEGVDRVGVSVVPLSGSESVGPDAPTLLVLGKRRVCETLTVQSFARSHGLTAAETRVLTGLCGGATPTRIADDLGVAISTVRTQIGTLRVKTGAESIRALVRQVAQLPPLRGSLRQAPGRDGMAPDDGPIVVPAHRSADRQAEACPV